MVTAFLRLRRQLYPFGDISVRETPADGRASVAILNWLEKTPPDNLERLLGRDRLPKRLHAAECLFEGAQGGNAPLAAGLDIGFRQRREYDRRRHQLSRFGQCLDERQVAVVSTAAQDLPFRKLPDIGNQLVDQDDAGRIRGEQLAQ